MDSIRECPDCLSPEFPPVNRRAAAAVASAATLPATARAAKRVNAASDPSVNILTG